jgi:hypothetical protein
MKRLKITTLDKGLYDKDEVLLHAAFQLLLTSWNRSNQIRSLTGALTN